MYTSIYINRSPRREERKGAENILEKIVAKNIPTLMKKIKMCPKG